MQRLPLEVPYEAKQTLQRFLEKTSESKAKCLFISEFEPMMPKVDCRTRQFTNSS